MNESKEYKNVVTKLKLNRKITVRKITVNKKKINHNKINLNINEKKKLIA